MIALVLDTKAFAERGAVTDGAERVGRGAVSLVGISGNTMRV